MWSWTRLCFRSCWYKYHAHWCLTTEPEKCKDWRWHPRWHWFVRSRVHVHASHFFPHVYIHHAVRSPLLILHCSSVFLILGHHVYVNDPFNCADLVYESSTTDVIRRYSKSLTNFFVERVERVRHSCGLYNGLIMHVDVLFWYRLCFTYKYTIRRKHIYFLPAPLRAAFHAHCSLIRAFDSGSDHLSLFTPKRDDLSEALIFSLSSLDLKLISSIRPPFIRAYFPSVCIQFLVG